MDQFSSQLANNLENGYTAGVPEHLIQVYRELSAWCELIQYKIDVDINTQDDIRKQVLSNNLLKHIQGLWQERVNEFYMVRRDEVRDNLSYAIQNRINNSQKVIDGNIMEDNNQYQNVYTMPMPTNEQYFNDNDSLSSEEDYYQRIDELSANSKNDQNKMVVVVKYNNEQNMIDNYENYDENYDAFNDEYEFDYGNDNYDYNEYDDYDLHHYKEANVTKVSINYTTPEERDDMFNNYGNLNDYRNFYERPETPSLPDWPSSYEEVNTCAADCLNHDIWNNQNCQNYSYHQENEQLGYTEQLMREKEAKEGYLSYTEQIMKEQRKLSYVSFGSVDLEEDNNSICSIKQDDQYENSETDEDSTIVDPEMEESADINSLSTEITSLTLNDEEEDEKETLEAIENENENENKNELSDNDNKKEKHRLSITIDETVINGVQKKESDKSNEIEIKNEFRTIYKEHLYPRTIKSRDLYYEDYGQDSPSADSLISPNDELLFTPSTDEEIYEYSSKKDLMTPLSSGGLSYTDTIYSSDSSREELESNNNSSYIGDKKILLPIEINSFGKEENFTKYLLNRRDSGFSETCDEPFINA